MEAWVCAAKISLTALQRGRAEAGCDELRLAVQAKRAALGSQNEEVLRLQEDLALLLSRLGHTGDSRPMWRQLLKARMAHAPARAALAKKSDKRNAQVWYTVCARKGAVGGWDEAAAEVPIHCSSNNSQARVGYCDFDV